MPDDTRFACQCPRFSDVGMQCSALATQEDGLCDTCRDNRVALHGAFRTAGSTGRAVHVGVSGPLIFEASDG